MTHSEQLNELAAALAKAQGDRFADDSQSHRPLSVVEGRMTNLAASLAAPFPEKDIEWRIGRSGLKNNKPWGLCLAYITNRAIMERLDATVGPENWKNEFVRWGEHGVLCGLSIRCDTDWVTKWDGAQETDIEGTKGGLSGAMKRAAVQWGIGRYLYGLEEGWAVFGENGPYSAKIENIFYKWSPPALPAWALPRGAASEAPPQREARSAVADANGEVVLPFGKQKGTPLSKLSDAELQGALTWANEKAAARFADFISSAAAEIASRKAKALAIQNQPLDQTPLAILDAEPY